MKKTDDGVRAHDHSLLHWGKESRLNCHKSISIEIEESVTMRHEPIKEIESTWDWEEWSVGLIV